eukprot:GAHX01000586.1.p1 GENE.GAHX01000586.1~~GAHX01000586.1.p1  ORF type:complete len:261 (-),score=37.34 GAHX01000586.1:82-816(-)
MFKVQHIATFFFVQFCFNGSEHFKGADLSFALIKTFQLQDEDQTKKLSVYICNLGKGTFNHIITDYHIESPNLNDADPQGGYTVAVPSTTMDRYSFTISNQTYTELTTMLTKSRIILPRDPRLQAGILKIFSEINNVQEYEHGIVAITTNDLLSFEEPLTTPEVHFDLSLYSMGIEGGIGIGTLTLILDVTENGNGAKSKIGELTTHELEKVPYESTLGKNTIEFYGHVHTEAIWDALSRVIGH